MTLLEVLIGSSLGIFTSLAAFEFAKHEMRLTGVTRESLDMTQSGRVALDMIAEDLRHAGVGVGYASSGSFVGLRIGSFLVDGVSFNSDDVAIPLESASTPTDDIGMLMADGGFATIAAFDQAGTGQICAGPGVLDGQLAVLRSEDGISGRSVQIDNVSAATCSRDTCVGGCESFTWTSNAAFQSDSSALTASYLGGEMAGGLKNVVWFVEAADSSRPGIGALRRAVFDNSSTCTARDASCGVLVAENVESLQMQVWRWDADANSWSNATSTGIGSRDRVRVDLELVVRTRLPDDHPHPVTSLRLETGTCIPSCSVRDHVERRVYYASAELRNSGRMRIR